ncbi:MAG TPA: glycosyltransferase, partial [Elusimicrobiota bacterium]|nr:glycosyltransferase [Elusimicrobiota bacterium]
AAARRPGAKLNAHTGHAAALAFLASRFGGAARVAHRRVDFRLSGAASARLKYASAGRVVAVSEAVRELLVEDGVPARRVRVVPDCLPLSEEEARRAGETDWMRPPTSAEREAARAALSREFSLNLDEPWIGCLAALVPHKDHATLLRAFALVAAARPCRLLLAGEGPLEGELKELARALGVEFRVLFAGQQARPLVWLHAVDLFALSSWGEGMGSVLLEAMACGVPIAATRAGGIPEAAPDGSCALLAPPRDPKALADALLACLADPAGAARRAEEARRRVRSFGSAEAARRMEDVYEEALS